MWTAVVLLLALVLVAGLVYLGRRWERGNRASQELEGAERAKQVEHDAATEPDVRQRMRDEGFVLRDDQPDSSNRD